MKIGIIGLGKMGEALLQGLLSASGVERAEIQCTTHTQASAEEVSRKFKGVRCHSDNLKLAEESQVVIICVKPYQFKELLGQISKKLGPKHLVISVAAGVTTGQLVAWSGGKASVIRAMPNTPCLVGEGMTVFSPAPGVKAEQMGLAEKIFNTVGKTAVVEDALK